MKSLKQEMHMNNEGFTVAVIELGVLRYLYECCMLSGSGDPIDCVASAVPRTASREEILKYARYAIGFCNGLRWEEVEADFVGKKADKMLVKSLEDASPKPERGGAE